MIPAIAAALVATLLPFAAPAQQPSVRTLPSQPLVERLREGRQLNFDLLFENPGEAPLELVGLELTRYDHAGRFIGQQRLDRNGDAVLEADELPGGRGKPITLRHYQDNLRRQFHKLDRNHDGYLDARELTQPPQA